jgi:nitroreductase
MQHPVDQAIRQRRARRAFDGSPVSKETILELLGLAILAPMHRLTNPWRFRILDKPALERLCQWWSNPEELRSGTDEPDVVEAKAHKFCHEIVPQIGAVVVVTTLRDANPLIDRENRDAVAAAIQNILIAAEARQLGTFWSTGPHWYSATTLQWLGIDRNQEELVAVLWLGDPVGDIKQPPRKPLEEVAMWL